jgi:hypothetical protein
MSVVPVAEGFPARSEYLTLPSIAFPLSYNGSGRGKLR